MKKIIAMLLVVALTAAISVGATLAYLTDTDEDVNVMTLGNVQIEQIEQERDENGNLVPFTQAKPAYPVVGDTAWAETGVVVNGTEYKVFADGLKNVVDKIVTVKNTGKSDAFVRTIVALEAPDYDPNNLIHVNVNGDGLSYTAWTPVEIDGVDYVYSVFTYDEALAPNGISAPSLMQVFLDKEATNEDVGKFGDTWEIRVISQAVQTAGFDGPETALNTAFGEVTKEKAAEWFAALKATKIVEAASSEELATAISETVAGEPIIVKLATGEYTTNLKVAGGRDITIVGNGEDTVLSGQIATTASNAGTLTIKNVTINVDSSIVDSTGISQTGKSAIAIWGDQTVICENVTFNMSLADSTAITSWWDTGVGTSIVVRNCTFNCNGQRPIRATGNVTVENTTFNDPYRYAVQLTAKTSTATELDKAVVNFVNNTIVNGENGKDLVYGLQLEGADYGCHDLVINGSGNTIVDGGAASTMYYCECGKVDHDTIEWNVEVESVHEG